MPTLAEEIYMPRGLCARCDNADGQEVFLDVEYHGEQSSLEFCSEMCKALFVRAMKAVHRGI